MSPLLSTMLTLLAFSELSASSWKMWIYNSNDTGSDTDANVYLQAFFSGNKSDNILVKGSPSGLEKGEVNVFQISLPDFDKLEYIIVQRDENGSNPPWKVDKIVLQKYNEPIQYVFKCHCWIKIPPTGTRIKAKPKNVTITTGGEFTSSPKDDVTSGPMTGGTSPRKNETTGTGFISSPMYDVSSVPMTGGTSPRGNEETTGTGFISSPMYDVTSVPMTGGTSPRGNEETTGTGFIFSPKYDVTSVPMTNGSSPRGNEETTGTGFISSPMYDVTSVPMTGGTSPRRNEETTGTGFISSPKDDVTSVPMTGGTLLRSSSGVTRTIEVAPPTVENTKQTSNKDTTAENTMELASKKTAPPVARSETKRNMCTCLCEAVTDAVSVPKNTSLPKEIEEELQKMIMEMKVDKETLSKYVRQKTSAEDKRPSAVAIGSAGVVLLVAPFVLILFLDLVPLVKYAIYR